MTVLNPTGQGILVLPNAKSAHLGTAVVTTVVVLWLLSGVPLVATPWTAAARFLRPWGFPGYSSAVVTISCFRDLPHTQIEPMFPAVAASTPVRT